MRDCHKLQGKEHYGFIRYVGGFKTSHIKLLLTVILRDSTVSGLETLNTITEYNDIRLGHFCHSVSWCGDHEVGVSLSHLALSALQQQHPNESLSVSAPLGKVV